MKCSGLLYAVVLVSCTGEGPRGEPGPAGPRGPAGPPGSTPLLSVYAVVVEGQDEAVAWCDDTGSDGAGDIVTGGWCEAYSTIALDAELHEVDGVARGIRCTKTDADVTATAVCLSVE